MTRIHHGDALAVLREMADASINCCVTSPPYWGLRDYGTKGQIGLEATPTLFVGKMVEIFAQVRRVLRDDGTLWLNLGDSYAGSWGSQGRQGEGAMKGRSIVAERQIAVSAKRLHNTGSIRQPGLKPKDLVGIPWRVAFALQADGWWLRQDIIWHKPNPMPESVGDRCTKAHEYIFLLTKSQRYHFDAAAISEPCDPKNGRDTTTSRRGSSRPDTGFVRGRRFERRNKRSVWKVSTQCFKGGHFATFPEALIRPCVLAGCPEGGIVLDPFAGAGTTLLVAEQLGRDSIGIELNADYVALAAARLERDRIRRMAA